MTRSADDPGADRIGGGEPGGGTARARGSRRSAVASGAGLAVLAAVCFGVTTPLVERFGRGVGALPTAALLYAGASLAAIAGGGWSPPSGGALSAANVRRLLVIAVFGAGLAPTLLAWGLQRTGATTGSLLLNLEAVFTAVLAWLCYREPIGRRVALALALIALGGLVLALRAATTTSFDLVGAAAVAGATLAWAVDNTISRRLAEQDPAVVVAAKGALGAALTGGLALAMRDSWPGVGPALALVACGATGYGSSLRLYLLAQRRIGAARTGSIFAVAPFLGAALGWLLGDRSLGVWALPAGALFVAGVLLHVTERHEHAHLHPELEHDHPHRHDDGHHGHVHDPPVGGEHSHRHRHARTEHVHDHAPDVHHQHAHG